MSEREPDRRSLLRHEGSDLSDTSTALNSPSFPHQRHAYHRMNSQGSEDVAPNRALNFSSQGTNDGGEEYGLGIIARPISITRVPVGSRGTITPASPSKSFTTSPSAGNSPMTPQTPGSSKPLLSPYSPWQRHGSGNLAPMMETDEQDISKSKSPYADSLEIGYTEEQAPQSLNDVGGNDTDKHRESCLPSFSQITDLCSPP